jgi:hypothetical protein
MAYGMLTSFALGAAQGLGTAMINKYSKDQDAEIKLKADQEREARIEEAAIRSEGRASTREDLKYNKLRADTLADKETQYAQDYIVKGEDAQRRADEEQRKQAWEKDPTNPSYQSTMQQINASKESVKASESTLENAKLTREKTQLEIDKEKGLADLTSRINAETDSTKRDTLIQQAKVISGKFNDKADQIKTTEIDTGRVDENGKSITKKILVRVEDNGNWNVLPVEERLKMAQPYDKEQADIVARDITNRQLGARVDNLLLDRDKNNADRWDKAFTENQSKLLTTKQGDTVSFDDNKGGMLSLNKGTISEQPIENPLDSSKTQVSKTTEKAIEQTVKTATANPLIKFTDDPVKQGQFDTITGVLLYSESGLKGANVGRPKATPDNPHPTADGSYQLTNIAMKDLNIKPDLPNGEYSVEAKEKAAPDFYKKAYTATQGDASAFLAYRFSPPDIKQAVEKAKKEGGNWWDYAKSDLTKANMPTVIRDAERTMMQLARENKRVPLEISKIILANK